MKASTKAGALVPAIKHAGQTLALLCVLALLRLFGGGVSHLLLSLYPQPSDPDPGPSARMASNGEIIIGSPVAATNGVRIAGTKGDMHIGS